MSVAVQQRVQARHAPHSSHSPHPQPPILSKMPNPTSRPARTVAAKPPPASTAASSSSRSSAANSPTASLSAASSSSVPTPRVGGSSGLPALAVPGKDLSSSTGRIFAKPSKEWVLPERAKPGRKAATDEPENRRQSQNRLSQRAHRARRTDYIQTLEERLRKYEADEIHSNVRLQEVARALKADNERMRNELNQLASQLSGARSDRDKWNAERQKLNDTIKHLQRQLETATLNTHNSTSLSQVDPRSPHDHDTVRPSPVVTPVAITPRNSSVTPRMLAQPTRTNNSTLACPICPDPDPDCPCQSAMEPALPPSRLDPTLGMSSLSLTRCGLCDLSLDACICGPTTTVAEEEDIKPDISSPAPMDDTDCGLCTSESFCACRAAAAASSSTSFAASFSLNLQIPASPPTASPKSFKLPPRKISAQPSAASTVTVAAPAVALKLRRRPAAKQSVWSLDNVPAGTSRKEAVCTGDPNNCDACRNDSFGREFCENLFGKPHKKCSGCGPNGCGGSGGSGSSSSASSAVSIKHLVNPTTPVQQPLVLACCGAPELCGGHAAGCAGEVLIGGPADRNGNRNSEERNDETMRPEEAWRALKAHPNSKYTPLAILADVVARRSKVSGPRVELSPEPEGRCETTGTTGAKRRLAVETSAVREALKYLDTHGEGERGAKRQRV